MSPTDQISTPLQEGKSSNRFRTLVEAPIEHDISIEDLHVANNTLPFIAVPGSLNFRDLGHPPYLQPGLIYRSGTLSSLAPKGVELMIDDLRISTVFDFRSAGERKVFPFPELKNNTAAIEVKWLPSDSPPADTNISDFVDLASETNTWHGGARGFSIMYLDTLEKHQTAFKAVLQHLLNRPDEAIVFNCTAGKDRTGVMAALLLSLVGVPDEEIAADYALSRIGIEPQKKLLTGIVKKWKPEWTPETPGMRGFSNVRPEYMAKYVQDAQQKYAGSSEDGNWAFGYASGQLGFSSHELETIRANVKGRQQD